MPLKRDQAVLITGGAGYIGSHTVLACLAQGHGVVVLDNLSTGHRSLVPGEVPLIEGDAGDRAHLERIFDEHDIGAVIHFAGDIVVPESVVAPLKYYENNTCKTRNLVQSCIERGVGQFIFSSTAAVYGDPAVVPVSETSPTLPINPYGCSKLMSEWILRDTAAAHDFRYIALRYFNVAGADPAGRSGQATPNATHLIKIASEAAAGKRDHIDVFGADYDTPDGTCVRDYIHVSDLAAAHVSALDHLDQSGESLTLNCGYGRGYSVREVLDAVQREAGPSLDIRPAPRRPGDAAKLVSDPTRLLDRLDWRPQHDDLDFIVRTALKWERALTELA